VIFVATVHFRSAKWVDIQLAYLRRNISVPYCVYANLDNVPGDHEHKFDRLVPAGGGHSGKLNLLAAEIAEDGRPDDILLFLDGDAFPVKDPTPKIFEALQTSALLAIRRDENLGERQPHPSFCAVRLDEWQRLHGDWSQGRLWRQSDGRLTTDVGANLLASLERSSTPWTPLLRTNRVNPHPLWFGVYGGVVYHHGAGFRIPMSRVDRGERPSWWQRTEGIPVAGAVLRRGESTHQRIRLRRRARAVRSLGAAMYSKIENDPTFYRELV
jgi:hypothetical protein